MAYYPSIFLMGLREHMKVYHDRWSLGQTLNQRPPDMKQEYYNLTNIH
jgi:hypothetical protein